MSNELATAVSRKLDLPEHGVVINTQFHDGANYFVIWSLHKGRVESTRLLISVTDEKRLTAHAVGFVNNLAK